MQGKPLTLNVLALDGPPGPKRLWERDRSWPAPSIARIPGCSSGHREPVRPSAARRLGPRYRRCWACSTGSSGRQPGQPHADVGPFAASDLFFSFLAPPFPEKRRRPAHGVKRPPPLAASLWMRDDDVPRVAQTSSWSRLCSIVPQGCREVADLEPPSRQINQFALLCPDSVLLCADHGSKGRRVSDALRPSPNQRTRRLIRRDLKVHEARATTYVGGR